MWQRFKVVHVARGGGAEHLGHDRVIEQRMPWEELVQIVMPHIRRSDGIEFISDEELRRLLDGAAPGCSPGRALQTRMVAFVRERKQCVREHVFHLVSVPHKFGLFNGRA